VPPARRIPIPFPAETIVTDELAYPALVLKRGEEARLRAGHLWVYSNEVDVAVTPLTAFEPGETAVLRDYRDCKVLRMGRGQCPAGYPVYFAGKY